MERCRGAPSWLTGKINAIHPPPSSSFTNLSTPIIYPPQISIPSSAHWAATCPLPAQQPYNHVNPYARRGSMPLSFTQSTQDLNGPAENVDYLGVKMSDDTTKRRPSEPCNSMLDRTPLMFEPNCNTNWSHISMGLMGTQSMVRNRGTSQNGSAGGDWPGGNQEVSFLSETNEASVEVLSRCGRMVWIETDLPRQSQSLNSSRARIQHGFL